jgi:hypothetical protein
MHLQLVGRLDPGETYALFDIENVTNLITGNWIHLELLNIIICQDQDHSHFEVPETAPYPSDPDRYKDKVMKVFPKPRHVTFRRRTFQMIEHVPFPQVPEPVAKRLRRERRQAEMLGPLQLEYSATFRSNIHRYEIPDFSNKSIARVIDKLQNEQRHRVQNHFQKLLRSVPTYELAEDARRRGERRVKITLPPLTRLMCTSLELFKLMALETKVTTLNLHDTIFHALVNTSRTKEKIFLGETAADTTMKFSVLYETEQCPQLLRWHFMRFPDTFPATRINFEERAVCRQNPRASEIFIRYTLKCIEEYLFLPPNCLTTNLTNNHLEIVKADSFYNPSDNLNNFSILIRLGEELRDLLGFEDSTITWIMGRKDQKFKLIPSALPISAQERNRCAQVVTTIMPEYFNNQQGNNPLLKLRQEKWQQYVQKRQQEEDRRRLSVIREEGEEAPPQQEDAETQQPEGVDGAPHQPQEGEGQQQGNDGATVEEQEPEGGGGGGGGAEQQEPEGAGADPPQQDPEGGGAPPPQEDDGQQQDVTVEEQKPEGGGGAEQQDPEGGDGAPPPQEGDGQQQDVTVEEQKPEGGEADGPQQNPEDGGAQDPIRQEGIEEDAAQEPEPEDENIQQRQDSDEEDDNDPRQEPLLTQLLKQKKQDLKNLITNEEDAQKYWMDLEDRENTRVIVGRVKERQLLDEENIKIENIQAQATLAAKLGNLEESRTLVQQWKQLEQTVNEERTARRNEEDEKLNTFNVRKTEAKATYDNLVEERKKVEQELQNLRVLLQHKDNEEGERGRQQMLQELEEEEARLNQEEDDEHLDRDVEEFIEMEVGNHLPRPPTSFVVANSDKKHICTVPDKFPDYCTILINQGEPEDYVATRGLCCVLGLIRKSSPNIVPNKCVIKRFQNLKYISLEFVDESLNTFKIDADTNPMWIKLDVSCNKYF